MNYKEKIRVLIADDELLARRVIRDYLSTEADCEIVGECSDGRDALDKLQTLEPDILFLDVQMPHLTGFEILGHKQLPRCPYVIFTTAYDGYALQAFEVDAVDYLLKPFDDRRFKTALLKARRAISRGIQAGGDAAKEASGLAGKAPAGPSAARSASQRIPVKIGRHIRLLDTESIVYAIADRDYIDLQMAAGETIHTKVGISQMAATLSSPPFYRTSRSVIVNADRVKEIRPSLNDFKIVMEDGRQFAVGVTYRDAVDDMLRRWNGGTLVADGK